MRQKMNMGMIAAIVLLAVGGIFLSAPAQAGMLLQELPRLDDYKIYFTEDNGEASRFDRSANGLSRLGGLLWQLGADMDTLEWRNGIPADADLIIMAGPNRDLPPDATARLWSYLGNGGRLLLLSDPVIGGGNQQQGFSNDAALLNLMWTEMGIRLGPGVLASEQSGGGLNTDILVTNLDTDHAVLAGVNGPLGFFRARSVDIETTIQPYVNTILVTTPAGYYGEVAFDQYLANGIARYDIGEDVARSRIPLVVTSEHPGTGTRVALIGNRQFLTNSGGLQTSPPRSGSFLYPDNIQLTVNLIAWLLGADVENTASLVFPTPGPTLTPTVSPTPFILVNDFSLSITTNNPEPREGDAVIFTVTIRNNGPEFISLFEVLITPPQNATYISAGASIRTEYNERFGTWRIQEMGTGAEATLNVVVLINRGTIGETVTLDAAVNIVGLQDPTPEDSSASLGVTVVQPPATER